MEVDRELIEGYKQLGNLVSTTARVLDVAFVPTSFTRTVMRAEDRHQEKIKWEEKTFEGRYHSKSIARWAFPVAYSVAGALEAARGGLAGLALYNAIIN